MTGFLEESNRFFLERHPQIVKHVYYVYYVYYAYEKSGLICIYPPIKVIPISIVKTAFHYLIKFYYSCLFNIIYESKVIYTYPFIAIEIIY